MRIFTSPSSGRGSGSYQLNAYILDFYIHGQRAALESANGIRDNDLWYLLDDFTLTLKSIRAGLGQLLLESLDEAAGIAELDEDALGEATLDPTAKPTGINAQEGEGAELPENIADEPGGGDDDDDDDATSGLTRPTGVSDNDWAVYKLIDAVTTEFEQKFRAIWA